MELFGCGGAYLQSQDLGGWGQRIAGLQSESLSQNQEQSNMYNWNNTHLHNSLRLIWKLHHFQILETSAKFKNSELHQTEGIVFYTHCEALCQKSLWEGQTFSPSWLSWWLHCSHSSLLFKKTKITPSAGEMASEGTQSGLTKITSHHGAHQNPSSTPVLRSPLNWPPFQL